MVDEWTELRLGELIEVKHGWPFKSELFSDDLRGGPIVINIGNFRYTGGFRFDSTTTREYRGNYPAEYELSAGDILLVMTCQTAGGEILGVPARVPADGRKYLHNQRLGRVIVNDTARLDRDYLYWLFLSPAFNRELYVSASGTKILHTAPTRIQAVQVRLPSPQEQSAIAQILGALDGKIELNRRMNETLEATTRGLFKSWFVDFEPVRAKAERRDPRLPQRLADLFPDSFDESELGKIPTGWRVAAIGELAKVVGGSTPSTTESAFWDGGDHHWVTPKDLSTLTTPVLLATERKITEAGISQIGSGLLPPGTVLLSSRAPIGYLVITEIPVAINQGFIAMLPSKGVSNLFLVYWAEWAHEEIVSRANGSTFLEISKANFRPIPVVAPNSSIFSAFDELVRPLYSRLVSNERESATLTAIRDALLPKLISGELRVKDAERFLATAPV